MATRNDDHGENMSSKNQYFINRCVYLINKYNISCEIIIVDWNSPSKQKLKDKITIPKIKNSKSNIKFIEVDSKVHKQYSKNKNIPFYQMIAKNAGIYRAKGEFILCTNIDIIFKESFFKNLEKQNLNNNTIYRANRVDIDFKDFTDIQLNRYNYKKITHINFKKYSIDIKKNKKYFVEYTLENVIDNIKFEIKKIIRTKYLFKKIKQYSFKKIKQYSFKKIKQYSFKKIKLRVKINLIKILKIFKKINKKYLYTNACGDFTLCHRNIWFEVSGYKEFTGYSFHIDSLFLWKVYAKSKKKINFGLMPDILHINHKIGSGFTPGNKKLFKNLREKKIPFIDNNDYEKKIKKYFINPDDNENKNWGLKKFKLKEKVF